MDKAQLNSKSFTPIPLYIVYEDEEAESQLKIHQMESFAVPKSPESSGLLSTAQKVQDAKAALQVAIEELNGRKRPDFALRIPKDKKYMN